jgi:uncharacterized membrane protein
VASTFAQDFKTFFLRGLAAVLPTVLTLAIIVWVFRQIHRYAGQYINIAASYLIALIQTYQRQPENFDLAVRARTREVLLFWNTWLWWVGFLLAIVAVYIFGRFVASFFGRWVWRLIEGGFFRLPVIRAVYPHVKQVTDFLLAERKVASSRVVAVEYPRKGIWSIGLLTSQGMRTLDEAVNEDLLTVFIPSSPTPVTGYTITVRRQEVLELPLSIDEALKFTVSAGVIMPLGQQRPGAEAPDVRRGRLPDAARKESSE